MKKLLTVILLAFFAESYGEMQTSRQTRNRDCRMENVRMKCRPGRGYVYTNLHTSTWNPYTQKSKYVDEKENCEPCCVTEGSSIVQCPETDIHGDIYIRGLLYAVYGSSSGQILQTLHCPNQQTRFKCRHGQGQRIFNTNVREWNPDHQVSVGVDHGWDCRPCCNMAGYSIQQC